MLKYVNSFEDLSNLVNQHHMVIWGDKKKNDEAFMENLIKPNSTLW